MNLLSFRGVFANFAFSSVFRVLALGVCLGLGACSITDEVSYEDVEGQIPESFFDDVGQHKISTGEAVEQLGEPVLIEKLGDDISVMTYRFSRVQIRNWRFLVILRSGSRSEDVSFFHVAYKGDEIKKTWVDDNLRIQKYHKLVQEVDPPPQKKHSGIGWKLPFFSKKSSEEAEHGAQTHVSSLENNGSQIAPVSGQAKSDAMALSGSEPAADSQRDIQDAEGIHQSSLDDVDEEAEPEINRDAFKVDLTL